MVEGVEGVEKVEKVEKVEEVDEKIVLELQPNPVKRKLLHMQIRSLQKIQCIP